MNSMQHQHQENQNGNENGSSSTSGSSGNNSESSSVASFSNIPHMNKIIIDGLCCGAVPSCGALATQSVYCGGMYMFKPVLPKPPIPKKKN